MMNLKNKFKFAFRGLGYLLKDHSVLLQLFNTAAAMVVSFLFHFESYEKLTVFTLCCLVVGTECVNSVVEYLAEQLDPSKDQAVGRIKDMMAGAVLIVSIGSLIAGIAILLRHI